MIFAKQLQKEKERTGLTYEEVASLTDCAVYFISGWVKGTRKPPSETVQRDILETLASQASALPPRQWTERARTVLSLKEARDLTTDEACRLALEANPEWRVTVGTLKANVSRLRVEGVAA